MTNADRIRQMTDEELASLLIEYPCEICDRGGCDNRIYGACTCKEYKLAWLKKEVL